MTTFKKLVLAILSQNLRCTCFWSSWTRPQEGQGEFSRQKIIYRPFVTYTRNFKGFEAIFFFYPSRESGRLRGFCLKLRASCFAPSYSTLGCVPKHHSKGIVFLSYESSMCKTEIKHPRVPFSNASQRDGEWSKREIQQFYSVVSEIV